MTDQDAYRRYTAEAESRFTMVDNTELTDAQALVQAAIGQGWATLALAAAQERVQPANRPTDDDPQPYIDGILTVKDGEGDRWYLKANGLYAMAGDTLGTATLEVIARMYNGYTEVP